MASTVHAGRMQKVYGRLIDKTCGRCCNYQRQSRSSYQYGCAAYGLQYTDSWPESAVACQLFNRPFLALEYKHRPLGDLYEGKAKSVSSDNQQISLFNDTQ